MIRVVVYLSGKAECQLLETQLRQLLSRRSNEELDCRFYADPAAARAALLAERADAICWDVTDPAGLAYLAAVRTAAELAPALDAPRADALTEQLDRLDALLDRLDEIQTTYDVCETAVTRAVESIRL